MTEAMAWFASSSFSTTEAHASALALEELGHADVGFAADAAEDQFEEVAGGQFGVAEHVPGCAPAEGAGEGVGDGSDVVDQRGHRVVVEADLRVGEVVVVEEDQ